MSTRESSKIAIYGAGGHGRVLLDVLHAMGLADSVIGWLDDLLPPGNSRGGHRVLGGEAWLGVAQISAVVLGVGQNAARARLAAACDSLNLPLITVIHPSAVVSPSAEIGAGTVVLPGAVINAGARIGRGCIVNSGAVVEHDCRLGDFCHVSPNATLGGAAELGALAHLGLGGSVLPGVSIGEAAVVGAGAVVTRAIPAGTVAYGVPARPQRNQA